MKNSPPTCRKCGKEVILADAGIFKAIPYYYCRTCKVEVDRFGYAVQVEKKEAFKDLEDYFEQVIPTDNPLELDSFSYPYNPFRYTTQEDQDQDIGSLSSRFAPKAR